VKRRETGRVNVDNFEGDEAQTVITILYVLE
jgi:hypothetical protein